MKIYIYEYTTPHLLVDFGIIDEDDYSKGGYITTRDAMHTISKFMHIYMDWSEEYLKEWYSTEEYAPLDYMADEDKLLIMNMVNYIISPEEVVYSDASGYVTNIQAYAYVNRIINEIGGCVQEVYGDYTKEVPQIYNDVIRKGFANTLNVEEANEYILREDFYKLLHKALFMDYEVGGYAGGESRYIYEHSVYPKPVYEKTERTVVYEKITPKSVSFESDLSVKYELPEEYSELLGEFKFASCSLIVDGEVLPLGTSVKGDGCIPSEDLIYLLLKEENKKAEYLRVSFYRYDSESSIEYKYYFDIDLSDVQIIKTIRKTVPGTLVKKETDRAVESISLGNGEKFQKNAFYMLVCREHIYRKEEYNQTFYEVFRSDADDEVFIPLDKNIRADTDDIKLRKITYTKNGRQIKLYVSALSEKSFEIKTINNE